MKQDGGRFRLIDIDPHAHEIGLEPVLDDERPASHAQGRVRPDDKDKGAPIQRS